MAYPVILYDATSGSDTAPSDAVATGVAPSGTGAATTISLGATVDLTGVADDDSDYIWCSTTAGERHLFQITSFTGGVSTCTAVVVAEAIGATTFSGANWHINGSRQTLESDTSARDGQDWREGWIAEFQSGTYNIATEIVPMNGVAATSTSPALTMRAASSAVSRPSIVQTSSSWNVVSMSNDGHTMMCIGLKLSLSNATSTSNCIRVNAGWGRCGLIDCVIDSSGTNSQAAVWVENGQRAILMENCYITGGTLYVVNARADGVIIRNCVIDGQGVYGTTAGISLGSFHQSAVDGCVVGDCDGDGIITNNLYGGDSTYICNNTIVNNTGNGFTVPDVGIGSSIGKRPQLFANNIVAHNGLFGVRTPTLAHDSMPLFHFASNSLYGNTSGPWSGQKQETDNIGGVTPTTDPFTNEAIGDYTLNSVSTGGALLREAAYPSTLPDGT